jgi:NAD(P) transhydrogenase subunit alpha
MKVAVLKETAPGETRVALVPANIPQLLKFGLQVVIQSDAGLAAGFADDLYRQKGAVTVPTLAEALDADVLLQVRGLGANPAGGPTLRAGQMLMAMCDPLGSPHSFREATATKGTVFALELIPRITRAQSMDVLSSMATIAGYRAVLRGALELPKLFPMMMTAAGTLTAAKVFVIGAGVAGLQAIAIARKLGAVAQAWDVRADCREQVESLGGKFVDLQLDTAAAQDQGGYAKDLGEEFYRRQREAMAKVVAPSDVVISTAAIPGKRSPLLITKDAVERMQRGSVIVDLAAERGGNCELTVADQRIVHNGVIILGPTNLPGEAPYHASQMFSNNVTKFLLNMVKEGAVQVNLDDEIVAGTLVTRDGEVTHPRVREVVHAASAVSSL